MSGQLTSVIMFASLVAVAVAANRAGDSALQAPSTRAPASLAIMEKEEKLGPFLAAPELRHTEKLRGPLQVSLEMIGAKPENIGDVFVMRGRLVSSKDLDSAYFAWVLPKGAELVNGALTGTVTAVNPENPAIVEITLRKSTAENVQIHLQASAIRGGARFGASARFSTEGQELLGGVKAVPNGNKPRIKIFH